MLIIIHSPPASRAAREAIDMAAEQACDIVLTHRAVGLALRDALKGFCGTAFALGEHMDAHLPPGAELEKGVKRVTRSELEAMIKAQGSQGPY